MCEHKFFTYDIFNSLHFKVFLGKWVANVKLIEENEFLNKNINKIGSLEEDDQHSK